jgi:hypothetical protein
MAEDIPERQEVGGLVILMMKIKKRPDGRFFIRKNITGGVTPTCNFWVR